MEYKLFCGNNKIDYSQNYKLSKKIKPNIKKFKINLNNNYLVKYFNDMYLFYHRKQFKLISHEILNTLVDKNEIDLTLIFDIFNKFDLPIFIYNTDGVIYSRNINKYKIKNLNFFYNNNFLYLII